MHKTYEEKVLDAKEFTSLLLSCQLSVEFNKDKPNRAIKHTLKKVKERISSPTIKLVCDQGLKSPYPVGWLSKQFNNIARIGNASPDEFTAIGASL